MTARSKRGGDSALGRDRVVRMRAAPAEARRDSAAARRVLEAEIEGLRRLGDVLDDKLAAALDLLAGARGRIVVTGMGKSGHVANKIAATLASTGSPAMYVHPAEASHGDLGMIAEGDAVLALSNSGDTTELADIVAYTRRFRIPLVAITGGRDSALAEAADAALILPAADEACPLGLAPTTSTTMMMALGDALAVALLERRGFTPSDFRALHPGGKLGRRLTKVADLMHRGDKLPLAPESTTIADAVLVISEKSFGCVGIVDSDGRLIGIVTDGDLRRHMSPALWSQTAAEIMTPDPQTIPPQALAGEALAAMNMGTRRITALFVVEDDRPIGIVHMHDLLRAGVA
jgi:arabinose-5-phosphate isomerase